MERIRVLGERQLCTSPGQFILGKAEALCSTLLQSYAGQARLIYLDPPFGTGDVFTMRTGKGNFVIPAYYDTLDDAQYQALMRTVLSTCRELLTPDGSLYLHIDYRKSAKLRLMLDDIFGESNFVNEIIWAYKSGGRATRYYPRKHDTILFYRKSPKLYFNIQAVGVKRGAQRRNHMKKTLDENGRVVYSIRTGGRIYTYPEDTLIFPSDVWQDIEHLHQRDPERTGYATQKPEALLERIIAASSEPGDLVLDLFSGSGTTAATAARMSRAWVAVDASPLALATLRRRLVSKAQNASMLDPSHSMSLVYELNDLAKPAISLEERDGQVFISPKHGVDLDYMALGTRVDDIFIPHSFTFSPNPDIKLHIEQKESPVLQAVDLSGHQGFWLINSF